jgi:hypothetical protein
MARLVSLKHAAEESGLPYSSLRDAGLRGLLPVVRINRSWYLDRVDLDRFIESRKERLG